MKFGKEFTASKGRMKGQKVRWLYVNNKKISLIVQGSNLDNQIRTLMRR